MNEIERAIEWFYESTKNGYCIIGKDCKQCKAELLALEVLKEKQHREQSECSSEQHLKTNFDKIKQMSVEEYATWHFERFTISSFCHQDCPDLLNSSPSCFTKCFEKWLRSEATIDQIFKRNYKLWMSLHLSLLYC